MVRARETASRRRLVWRLAVPATLHGGLDPWERIYLRRVFLRDSTRLACCIAESLDGLGDRRRNSIRPGNARDFACARHRPGQVSSQPDTGPCTLRSVPARIHRLLAI